MKTREQSEKLLLQLPKQVIYKTLFRCMTSPQSKRAFSSNRLSKNPLSVKIPLAAKFVESFIKVKDSEVSRQLLIFEYAGILKLTTLIMSGRFGVNVNTYQILELLPVQNIIQNKVERIKEFYENKSPLAVIKRCDLSSI